MKTVIFVGSHPDDIEVLAGGTAAKYNDLGYKVIGIVLSDVTKERKLEAKASAKILGYELITLNFPRDIAFIEKNIKLLDFYFREYNPDIIITQHYGDSHQGHQATANLVFAACRKNNATVLMFERAVPGGITPYVFRPQYFIDITNTIDRKLAAVDCHKTQGAEYWKESVKGRAAYWGQVINCEYAEVFEVNKIVEKL